MPKSNKSRRSFFQRISQAVSKGIELLRPKKTKVKKEKSPTSKKITNFIKKITGGSSKIKPIKTVKSSSRSIPEIKYKNKKGVKISNDIEAKIRAEIKRYNEEIKKYREKIIERAKIVFDPIIVENMEAEIERAVKRDTRNFDNSLFQDLRDFDETEILDRINEDTDVDDFLQKLTDRQSIEDKAKMYQENYVKALFNEYGVTTQTLELADLIESLDSDIFMMSYYNTWSDTHLNDIYDSEGQASYVDKLTDYFKNLKDKETELLSV